MLRRSRGADLRSALRGKTDLGAALRDGMAQLVQAGSLNALSKEEHQRLWTEEAARRDAELDADLSRGRPAEAVFRGARARLPRSHS